MFVILLILSSLLRVSVADDGAPFRFQSSHEFMTPHLSGDSTSVPNADGSELIGTNLLGFFWLDYRFTEGFRFLYYQRHQVLLDKTESHSTVQTPLLDPRFGVRQDINSTSGLNGYIDYFFQPGITPRSKTEGKQFDVGTNINLTYPLPASRWSIGTTTELTASYCTQEEECSDFAASFAPFLSYTLSNRLSSQHWLLFPFQHLKGNPAQKLSWDMPTNGPIMQNGIGFTMSDQLWLALLLNNHLTEPPQLRNTWLSLWINLTFI
jgi:hypothetical protein